MILAILVFRMQQAQKFTPQRDVFQEGAPHDGILHQGPVVLDAAPVHAEVAGLDHDRQPVGIDQAFKLIGQHDHGFLLDLRTAHDPVADARVLRKPDQI